MTDYSEDIKGLHLIPTKNLDYHCEGCVFYIGNVDSCKLKEKYKVNINGVSIFYRKVGCYNSTTEEHMIFIKSLSLKKL